MVIVRLIGGLANQMFPYAVGRSLAHRLGTELKLDISGFAVYRQKANLAPRSYGLDAFFIREVFATTEEIESLKVGRRSLWSRARKMLFGISTPPPVTYVKEKQFEFDPEILQLTGDVYLDGNWNSYRYFEDTEEIIRSEFTFRHPQSGKNLDLLGKIVTTESVSLHIRRGDFASNPKVNALYGTCDLDYYQRCVNDLAKRVEEPHFFIFSDEPEWVRGNLHLPFAMTIIDHNGPDQAHEDLRLMSQCRHHILANSGFSWWGAWLDRRQDKLVYAPKEWFKSGRYDTGTLLPPSWFRM
jgi:hypothetical protein